MAVKPERMNTPIPTPADPAVDAAINRDTDIYARMRRQREMTPGQRKRAERDAQRTRIQYDLPQDLIDLVDHMAHDTYNCPSSHLVALFILAGVRSVGRGELDVWNYLSAGRYLRWNNQIDIRRFEAENPAENGWRKS